MDVDLTALTGSPAALADRAAEAARSVGALDDARATGRQILAALDGQRGGAVTSATSRLGTTLSQVSTCAGVLEAASGVLHQYAGELGRAQEQAARALADRDAALARERGWQAEADRARGRSTWNTVGLAAGGLGAADVDSFAVLAAEHRAAGARAEAADAEAHWRRARDAKAAASRRAATELRTVADVRAVRVATAAGMGVAAYGASAAAGRRWAAALPAVAGSGAARDELWRELVARREDPAFWAAFWDATTPDQLYRTVGPSPDLPFDATPPQAAEALSQGARQWARTASPDELRAYGRSVVDGVGTAPIGLQDRSVLAAALLPPGLPAPAHAAAGDALDARRGARAPGRLEEDELEALAPLAVAVLAGHARHGRIALDRLAPPDDRRPAEDAVARWLGVVPRHGWPDGGTAAAGAFAAAVTTGARSPDLRVQRRTALLVSHATRRLPRGLLSTPGLSEAASTQIARAYEPYLPSMGDATRAQSLNRDCDDPAAAPPPAPGIDADRTLAPTTGLRPAVVQPTFDAFALRDVVAATSHTPGAAAVWLDTTDRYAASMVGVATSGAFDVDTTPRAELVRESMSDIGAVTGAMQSKTISVARSEAELRQRLIDVAGTGVGLATFGSGKAVSAGAEAVADGLAFVDPDAPLVAAHAQVRVAEGELLDRYAPSLHDAVLQHDLDLGRSEQEAERRTQNIDPDASDGRFRADFTTTFRDLSEAPDPTECR